MRIKTPKKLKKQRRQRLNKCDKEVGCYECNEWFYIHGTDSSPDADNRFTDTHADHLAPHRLFKAPLVGDALLLLRLHRCGCAALGSCTGACGGSGSSCAAAAGQQQRRSQNHRSEERRVGKECRSRWSPYH